MLPTSAGIEPATSWSPVGRRIQLSHRGRHEFGKSHVYWKRDNVMIRLHGCTGWSGPLLYIYNITKTRLFKYIENFTTKKNEIFQIKNSNIFHISAPNIDCGYSLEPPRRGGSNEYPQSMLFEQNKKNNVYPCKAQFYYIKVGFKGVRII